MYILLIGVTIYATIPAIHSMTCDEGWLEYNGKCFKHYTGRVPWTGGNATCFILRNALLASVDSPELYTFVHNLIRGSDIWIGLSIPDTTLLSWKWSDGGIISLYENWNEKVVQSACAILKHGNTEDNWVTKQCTERTSYICEKEMSNDNCSDWLSFETHCYLIITAPTESNMAAARKCWQQGAYLISINTKEEADFIYDELKQSKEYWIGLSPLTWVSGVPYQWNNWAESGPTQSAIYGCVYMNGTSGKWFSGLCLNGEDKHHHSYICQRDAVIDVPTTPNVAVEEDTKTTTVYSEFDELYLSTIPSSTENSKQLLRIIVPAVCSGLVAIIVIIVVVILLRRKRRSNESGKRNPPLMNTTYVTNGIAVGSENEDIGEHQDQEKYIYDEAEVVQADNGTVVVNGDVYAIVDKDKIQNSQVQDNMVSQQHTKNNRKQEIAKGQNHIIIGSDVYAIVNKNSVKPDKQQKPKQKKKNPPTPPKLEDKSEEINSNGLSHIVVGTDVYAVVDKDKAKQNKQQTSQQKTKKPPAPPKLEDKTEDINTNGHIVVGTDVYAVVDKEKVKPNKQQKPQQKKKKPPAPPKLVDKADVMHEGSVYYEPDMNAGPATPNKHKTKGKKKPEDTGVVYADLDLTGSGSGDRQNRNNDEESGVVYADVRG